MLRIARLWLLLCCFLAAIPAARAESVVDLSPAQARQDSEEDPSALEETLAAQGFRLGAPAFIRIFKADSMLELWMLRNGRFELYKRFPICKWSGVLGPKLYEGDRQSPEGVYFITGSDLIVNARWHRAMNVGYPNARDTALGLTGSGILIHGKCTSIGCFALTDDLVEEVYAIVEAALEAGQPRVPVHIFPFALTREKLAGAADEEWSDFWKELKRGHDLFLRDRLPPRTYVCNGRYAFQSRRAPLVSLAGNKVCTPVTRPARPVLAAVSWRRVGAKPAPVMAQRVQAARSGPCRANDRHCVMIKQALRSTVPCPRKYGRCRNPQIAAVKSIDCPLKYPRCRARGNRPAPALATLKTRQVRR